MEVTTALGVAANVIQFLDFGQRLFTTSFEIHRVANGASTAHRKSENLLRDFLNSIDTVSHSLHQYLSTCKSYLPQVAEAGTFQDVVEDCRAPAKDLLRRFERLRIQGKQGRWRSFVTGVKYMWKRRS